MRRGGGAGLTAAAIVAVLFAAMASAQGAPGVPYTPRSDEDVLQKVPAARDPAMQGLARLRGEAAADPRDVRAADALARAYLDRARAAGDARYAGYAEAVIAPWIARADPPPAVLVTQATILQYRHDFDAARALLVRAVALDRALPQAWLTLATLDLVQGRPTTAAGHCQRVARQGASLAATVCDATVQVATGRAKEASRALAAIDVSAASPSMRAWIAGVAAEAAERRGDWADAEAAWRRALEAAPGDNFLLVAYADFLLDRGRPRDVLTLLADATESDTAFLRLAIAHDTLRAPEAARLRWTMAARLAAYAQRGDDTAGREEARFHLALGRDPATALAAAQRNWQAQREVWDVRLLLASALAAGRPEAAKPALDFIAQTRLADPAVDALAARVRGVLP